MKTGLCRWLLAVSILGLLSACAGERPNNLGVTDGRLAPCPASPNCVSSQVEGEGQRIAPLSFSGDAEAAFARLVQVLRERKDAMIIDQTDDYLHVEFSTTFFVDDGEFLLDRQQQAVAVRSASRRGYSDLGKNRRRIEEIMRAFGQAGSSP